MQYKSFLEKRMIFRYRESPAGRLSGCTRPGGTEMSIGVYVLLATYSDNPACVPWCTGSRYMGVIALIHNFPADFTNARHSCTPYQRTDFVSMHSLVCASVCVCLVSEIRDCSHFSAENWSDEFKYCFLSRARPLYYTYPMGNFLAVYFYVTSRRFHKHTVLSLH